MVVLRESLSDIKKEFSEGFIEKIINFSRIIGYSVEIDAELKLEFNPDRQDLFSFYSINRAIECFYEGHKYDTIHIIQSNIEFKVLSSVRKIRPFVFGFMAHGKPIGLKLKSLISYQERIHTGLGKNRAKVAVGIHNLDAIVPPILYKAENMDTKTFETYDAQVNGTARKILAEHPKGQEYSKLIPSGVNAVFIEDSEDTVLSMPPVINGRRTVLSGGTENFFIDITGTDFIGVRNASLLLIYEMVVLGYSIEFPVINGYASGVLREIRNYINRDIDLNKNTIKNVLGIQLSDKTIYEALCKMGYSAEEGPNHFKVIVPGNRIDVMGPVDIIEDIGKAIDFSKLLETPLKLTTIGEGIKKVSKLEKVRDVMISMGFNEVMNFVVTSKTFYDDENYKSGFDVLNPKSLDFSVIRDRLYPGMLNFLSINRRRPLPQRIFEIGEVVENGVQRTKLCVMYESSDASYSHAKSALDTLITKIFTESYKVSAENIPGIIPGRGGRIEASNIKGIIGEVSPNLIEKFQLKNPVSFFEIYL
ncbi:phenylalanine--tRNA ligase subunit beta [Oxyplasma meridianum]|uniref:phenylalanine--tRNA ligase n=1 Tax=Oxyplasma meridianum TaxID=3073602 RepID=A0AAX4NGK2_9ARCH